MPFFKIYNVYNYTEASALVQRTRVFCRVINMQITQEVYICI